MKKISLLFLICILSALNTNAEVYEGSCGTNVNYSLDTNTEVLKISGTGAMNDYDNYSYSSSAPWNSYRSYIKSIEISNGVTSIGTDAFRNCSGLTLIEIPNSVTSIRQSAFNNCSGLTSIEIPNSVTSIGSYAFENCSGLTSIEIPNSVTSIGYRAFDGTAWYNNQPNGLVYAGKVAYKYKGIMPSNTSITINEGTLGIAHSAFYGCSGLTSIEIPNSVTSIGGSAFSGCTGLTSIEIPNSVTSIGGSAFRNCSGLTSIEIPNGVTSIGLYAFRDCSGLTSVTIPNSVTSIEDWAFRGCTGLTSITIPNSVTSIGSFAFENCSGLTSIELPNSVTSIGGWAFKGCTGELTVNCNIPLSQGGSTFADSKFSSVKIGDGVTSIGEGAFQNCSGLTSIEIPNSVTSIGSYAFGYCSGLTSIEIPNSVTSIEYSAFFGCSGLSSIIVESGNSKYDSRDNCNAIIETSTNSLIVGCKNTLIPNSVTSIGSYAFENCSGLTSIEIPNSVTSIGYRAFKGCTGELTVNCNIPLSQGGSTFADSKFSSVKIGDGVTSIGEGAFQNCSGLTSIEIPNSVTSIGSYAFGKCSGLTSIEIPNSVTSIGEGAFQNCSGLTSIEIPNSVTSIGSYAFENCSGLTSIEIPNSVTSIGYRAFDGTAWYNNQPNGLVYAGKVAYKYKGIMPSNTSITINEGTLGIASSAFYGCSGLTSVTIPNSVKSIGYDAFYGCTGELIVNCNIPSGTDNKNGGAFSGCKGLTSVTIGNSVTSIGDYAFRNCSGLTSITIPNSVTSIGSNAFYYCYGLTSVTIGNSVTSIGEDAFRGCSGLTSVTIPNSVTSIGNYAFRDCSNLTSITIPNSVTSIGEDAFRGCFGLTSVHITDIAAWCKIRFFDSDSNPLYYAHHLFMDGKEITDLVIPNSVTSIGSHAFARCSGLTSVTIGNSVTSIGEDAFRGCSGLTSVTIPNSVTSIGSGAFYWCPGLTSVTSEIMDLFSIGYDTFDSSVYSNAILYVPGNLIGEYESTSGWKNFKNIVGKNAGKSITMNITDSDNQDITNIVNVVWYDKDGRQIGSGNRISGVDADREIYYSVLLNEDLGRTYKEIIKQRYTSDQDTITCMLEKIGRVNLQGRIQASDIDKNSVTIDVKQMLNGKYEQIYSTVIDEQGTFNIEVYDDETEITIGGDIYLDAILHRDGFSGNGNIGTIPLNLISGFSIIANIGIRKVAISGGTEEISEWSGGLNNIEFELYNVTKNMDISDFTVQNGNVIIKSGAEIGDNIRITAKSKQGIFADASALFVIVEGTNNFSMTLTELGGIDVTCSSSNNSNTVGYLYNSNNDLIAKGSYVGETLSMRHLPNGTYTLITMGGTTLLGNMTKLSDLNEVGLGEGSDYVTKSVVVNDGVLTIASISEVPRMDDSRFYYTSGDTYFNANKESLTVGNYLTLTAHLNFKPEYSDKADAVKLLIDIPEGCQVVENSVIANRQAIAHTIGDNQLVMTLNKEQWQGQVRFCVIPVINKTYAITAMASFDIDGNVSQPIGTAQFEAKGLSLITPTQTANTNITINGTAKGQSDVSIYDNDVLIGKTSSKADGSWTATCELFKPYSHSFHDIYAKIITENGIELTSNTRLVEYDKNAIVPQKVTMTYYNGWYKENKIVEFNLIEGTTTPSSYPFYSGTDFTFLADFTRNDSTQVKNVNIKVLNSDGTVRTLPAVYDGKQNCWVATTNYSSSSKLPQNVAVVYSLIGNDSIDNTESFNDQMAILDNCRSIVMQYAEDNYDYSVIDESDSYVYLNVKEGGETDYMTKIEKIDFSEAVNRMDEVQFDFDYDEDGKLLCSYTEVAEAYTSTMFVDFVDSIAYTITMETDEQRSRSVKRKAPEVTTVVNRINGLANLAKFGNIVNDLIPYLSIPSDLSYMNGLYNSYRYNFDDINLKTQVMLRTKCDDSSFKLSEPIMNAFFEQTYSYKEEYMIFTNKLLDYIHEYERKVAYSAAYDLALTIAGGKAASMLLKCMKFTPYNRIVASLTRFLKKPYMKVMPGDNRRTVNMISNVLDVYLGQAIAAVFNPAFADFRSVYTNVSLWAPQHYETIMNKYFKLTNDIEHNYKNCKKEDKEIDDKPYNKNSGGGSDLNGNGSGGITNGTSSWGDFTSKGSTPQIDPSGYVYEAVLSNRLEGVTATCYQKVQKEDMYGDITEEAVIWNAEEYSQQNPLKTDAHGFYRWDVPQGMWQVKYEKEGYETAYSDWLPVPPPQLDVNVGMKQSTPPTVKDVNGTESGIAFEMSKYMKPETMTTQNITVTRNGVIEKGNLEMLNMEKEPLGEDSFVSKVKFVPNTPFSTSDVVVITIHKEVESYCGVNMENDFVKTIKIESEIKGIVADSVITVPYKDERELRILVLPKEASAGKILNVSTSSSVIASISANNVVIDDEGAATLTLCGEIPGGAVLDYTLKGTDVSATSKVKVVTDNNIVARPIANKRSGMTLEKGTEIILSCATEGATIYYTLDGSCPCNETEARKQYDGTPIIISDNVTIKAIAVAKGVGESDVAEFVYTVQKYPLDYYTYEYKSQKIDDRTSWTSVQNIYPNAIAVADNEYKTWANGQTNVLIENGNTYICPNFTLTDLSMYEGAYENTGLYSPYEFMVTQGSYKRQAYKGYNTICLPFNIKASDLSNTAKIYAFENVDETEGTVIFSRVFNEVEAGTPCIVKESNDIVWNINLKDKHISANNPINHGSMRGTYVSTVSYQNYGYSPNSDNEFAPLKEYLHPFRACFIINDAALARKMRIVLNDDITDIGEVAIDGILKKNGKYFENGRIVIYKNDIKYNVNGEKLR